MTNAEIYFSAAQMSMLNNQNMVRTYDVAFKQYLSENKAEYKTYNEQINLVLLNVRYWVDYQAQEQPLEGWAQNDYDSVVWFLGMFAKTMAEYISIDYRQLFIDCFNRHFSQYGMQ